MKPIADLILQNGRITTLDPKHSDKSVPAEKSLDVLALSADVTQSSAVETFYRIALPEATRARLMDPDLETDTTAIELMISTAEGWPALAHISVGVLLLGSDGLLRMALWRESRTCAALTEAGRGALIVTGEDQLLEVRCLVLAQAPLDTSKALTGFLLAPVASRDKRAPYATLRSGLRFKLHDAPGVHTQWRQARTALAALFPIQEARETLS